MSVVDVGPTRALRAETWKLQAACLDALDPGAFDGDATEAEQNVALSWCQDCPVAVECFMSAAASGSGSGSERVSGIWGGVMFREGVPQEDTVPKAAPDEGLSRQADSRTGPSADAVGECADRSAVIVRATAAPSSR